MKYKLLNLFCFVFFSLFLIESCSVLKPHQPVKDQLVIFPSPPDTARIQYLTSISNSSFMGGKQNVFSKFVLGEEQPKPIIKPLGINIRFGKIYVCDIGVKGLEIIDLENKSFEYFIPEGKEIGRASCRERV